jgi:predicted nucleic acid-binding protein
VEILMVTQLLDTDIVIDLHHKFPPAVAWYSTLAAGMTAIAVFVALEVVQNARNLSETRSAAKVIGQLPMLAPDGPSYAWAVAEFPRLHLGYGLSMADILVAATARTHSLQLCTLNVKHYRNIPSLTTVQPYAK